MVVERRSITVRGTVQGVGFRPFVYSLAKRLGLGGFVRNDGGAVHIEVEGEPPRLDHFLCQLQQTPPLARIVDIRWQSATPHGERVFRIESSVARSADSICVSPDVATCDDCLSELFDPSNRRYRFPFINCTNCGPRLTIVVGAPYDRPQTTMASFAMCERCRSEYEDPSDRRFHAQPICCPSCGPRLEICRPSGERIETADPLQHFAQHLRRGHIGALKGLGGYHLVCDAGDAHAVAELRRRKRRDEKPFALMVRDLAAARKVCQIDCQEQLLLESPRRPIVLLRRRHDALDAVCHDVAPNNPYLGVMLPYTPLHHLLLQMFGDAALVMTSGNRSDEPIAYLDDDAVQRLGDIADVILRHNRPIHVRCDDSVIRSVAGTELLMRRSRGFAPEPIQLPRSCSTSLLAVGGQFKATFALASEDRAVVSHHLGDLDHWNAFRQYERDITLYEQLFQISPEGVVHDLHPDYASTRYAESRAAHDGLKTLPVQHHHAHMASCMAENQLDELAIGVTLDGTGYGVDEATNEPVVWGGEFLLGDYRSFRRVARLRYVPMPGGDIAVRQPWRMATAHLLDAGCGLALLEQRISADQLRIIETMLRRRCNSPLTSSAGRLFDAVAAIAGLRDHVTYEGQAAVELEWLATDVPADTLYPFGFCYSNDPALPHVIDTRPLIRAVANDVLAGVAPRRIARRFHSSIVAMITETCTRLADQTGVTSVVLSGGVFMNALLTTEVSEKLQRAGLRSYRHRLVPPNDGGLSLGQIAIAAARCQSPAAVPELHEKKSASRRDFQNPLDRIS